MFRASALGAALVAATIAGHAAPAPAGEAAPVPELRALEALGAPEGQVDSGAGVYPALAPPPRLAFPGERVLAAAGRYARSRAGRVAFAVADGRGAFPDTTWTPASSRPA